MRHVLFVLAAVALIVLISQWNTLEMNKHLKSASGWLGPVLHPFYLARGK